MTSHICKTVIHFFILILFFLNRPIKLPLARLGQHSEVSTDRHVRLENHADADTPIILRGLGWLRFVLSYRLTLVRLDSIVIPERI